jgi:hypothetical protein
VVSVKPIPVLLIKTNLFSSPFRFQLRELKSIEINILD